MYLNCAWIFPNTITVRSLCDICDCCSIFIKKIKIHVYIKVEMDDKYAFLMVLNSNHFECLVRNVYIHKSKRTEMITCLSAAQHTSVINAISAFDLVGICSTARGQKCPSWLSLFHSCPHRSRLHFRNLNNPIHWNAWRAYSPRSSHLHARYWRNQNETRVLIMGIHRHRKYDLHSKEYDLDTES